MPAHRKHLQALVRDETFLARRHADRLSEGPLLTDPLLRPLQEAYRLEPSQEGRRTIALQFQHAVSDRARYQLEQILMNRRAYAEIGDPFTIKRFEFWREEQIAAVQAGGRAVRVPTDTALQARFGAWADLCVAALGIEYVPRGGRRASWDGHAREPTEKS